MVMVKNARRMINALTESVLKGSGIMLILSANAQTSKTAHNMRTEMYAMVPSIVIYGPTNAHSILRRSNTVLLWTIVPANRTPAIPYLAAVP